MTDSCRHCEAEASKDGLCGEHYWADKFLYVPSGGRKLPLKGWSWVANCPDDVDPRSEENPWVMTYEETLPGSEKHGKIAEQFPGWDNTWIRVGAAKGLDWMNIDLDIDEDGHEDVIAKPDAISFRNDSITLIRTSGGAHLDVLGEDLTDLVGADVTGVDYQGNMPGIMGVAGDPYHSSEGYEHMNTGRVLKTPEREDLLNGNMASYDGRSLVRERSTQRSDVGSRAGSEAEAPDDMPHCIGKMLVIRSTQLRYEYVESPFDVDKHLGQLLVFNGYSVEEAFSLLREYPPDKDGGFNASETRRQLKYLKSKTDSGDLSPPTVKLMDNDIDVHECDCPAHQRFRKRGDGEGMMIPEALSQDEASRRDRTKLHRARADVRRTLSQPIEGPMIYHAPQGLGKTRYTPSGASDAPRTVITTNKNEHRDTLEWAAEQEGVTCEHIVPFGDSWLASGASPVQDDVLDLYHQGVRPRFIINEYKDRMPEDVHCEYLEQFEGEPPAADILMGSPGHENVARFRQFPGETEDEPGLREIIYDDVNPADHEITENSFTLDGARAGLNEMIQEIPELNVRSVEELLRDRDARDKVQRLAVGEDEDEGEETSNPTDVWEALEQQSAEADAINVDLVDIVRRRENVRGETILRLKVVAGAEVRGMDAFSWRKGGVEHFSWVSHPDLSGHEVAVLSATHLPHVTEQWMEAATGSRPVHRTATDDWKAVRRAQGYLLKQTRSARNSRSGAGSYDADPEKRKESMRSRRDDLAEAIERVEGEAPGVIDSKKLLDDDGQMNFARVWSNNRFRNKHVGLVSGATYYGDDWVEARAAYCGETIDIVHEDGVKAYCEQQIGQDILTFMTITAVEQAVTRFGRSDEGETVVYVDTDAVPPHFPTIDISEMVFRSTATERAVYDAVTTGAETIEQVAAEVDVTRQQVGNVLWSLEEAGYIEIERFALEYGKHRAGVSESGCISINKVELSETDPSTIESLPRNAVDRPEDQDSDDSTAQLTFELFGDPTT